MSLLASTSPNLPRTGAISARRETNAQKNARTRALFFELRTLDKSQAPTDGHRRDAIREEIVSLCDELVRAAHAAFLKKRSGNTFTAQDIDDLLQEARVGLCKAMERFAPEKGTQFCTYAYAMAFGEMNHAARDRFAMIREPAWHHDQRIARDRAHRRGETYETKSALMDEFPAAYPAGHPNLNESQDNISPWLNVSEADFAPASSERVGIAQALIILKSQSESGARQACAIISHYFEDKNLSETAIALGISDHDAAHLIESGLAALRVVFDD